jgi:hypothetical protein
MPDNSPANAGAADPGAPANTAKRRPNALLWLGFLIVIFAFLSYIPIFARYPVTRDMPWANFLLFALGLVLLFAGLRRAFAQPNLYRGKIAGPILTTLGLAAAGLFCLMIFSLGKRLPPSAEAPRVGERAPDFALPDTTGHSVTLASLLSASAGLHPAKGILLIFYRGYW